MVNFIRFLVILLLSAWPLPACGEGADFDPELGVGACIWAERIMDRQECRFWKSIEIPPNSEVVEARLRATADNFYSVFIDGQQIGQGADWRVLIEYDVKLLMTPGKHVIAVDAFNDFDVAGLVLGLRIRMANGRVMEIGSDSSWKVVPDGSDEEAWKLATTSPAHWQSAIVWNKLAWQHAPQVYQAPPSRPVVIEFWQRKAFQVSLMALTLATSLGCVYMLIRLMLNSRTEKVMRQERARIAADFHDDLGGGITQIVMLGDSCQRQIAAESPVVETLGRLGEQTRKLLEGMNDTVWMINSQRDNTRDLATYIGRYAEQFFQRSEIRCRFDIETGLAAAHCDIRVRRNLFLGVKEALNNVLRHSGAKTVTVKIGREKNDIIVSIIDDGHGFDPAKADSGRDGLKNMNQRAAAAGGRIDISSAPSEGCVVAFRIPVFRIGPRLVFDFLKSDRLQH